VSDVHAAIAAYYSRKLEAFGPTPRGVDWNDEASQETRHRQFLRLIGDDRRTSVADLGCGYGSFLGFLRRHGHQGVYTGYDVTPAMIAAAERLHGTGADRHWHVGAHPIAPVDYVVASGIFNVKQDCATDVWLRHIEDTIGRMASAARRGWGFNVLSLHSDPERRRADLFYADPAQFLDRVAGTYGRSIAVLQDYGLYEFTLIVRSA
jgi:SAM-dependent methyltransferase